MSNIKKPPAGGFLFGVFNEIELFSPEPQGSLTLYPHIYAQREVSLSI